MIMRFEDSATQGLLELCRREASLARHAYKSEEAIPQYIIMWNQGKKQKLVVDGVEYSFCEQMVVALGIYQAYSLEDSEHVVIWRYNRNFYCISDHDREVSCIGLLFYGAPDVMLLQINEEEQRKFHLLYQVFEDEFRTHDTIQGEMLRVLLKRLIILLTRLAKQQYIIDKSITGSNLDLVRQFNVLVEQHYKKYHNVAMYASMLNKSPKTLSNFFALYNAKTPLEVIHDRIDLEARRLLIYTEKSVKEIGYELGFEEHTHFSNFFRKHNNTSPSDFRATHKAVQQDTALQHQLLTSA
jgi:AraC family transcriptional activator of pobA